MPLFLRIDFLRVQKFGSLVLWEVIFIFKLQYAETQVNSLIFRTITDDVTGANKSIGLFGLSLQTVENKLQEIQAVGFKNAIFNSSTIDTSAMLNDAPFLAGHSTGSGVRVGLWVMVVSGDGETVGVTESSGGAVVGLTETSKSVEVANTV